MHTYVIQSNNFAWHVLMSRHRIHNRAHFDSYKTRLLHVSSVYFLCTVQIEKNRKHIQTVDYFIIHNRISYLNFATHGYALDATPQIYHNHKCKHCGKWKLTANISFSRGISHIKRHVIPTFTVYYISLSREIIPKITASFSNFSDCIWTVRQFVVC